MLRIPKEHEIAENVFKFHRNGFEVTSILSRNEERCEVAFHVDYGIPDASTHDILFVMDQFFDQADQCFLTRRGDDYILAYYPGLVAN